MDIRISGDLVASEDFLAALRLRWMAALNLVALGLALGGLITLFAPAQYRSQVDLYAVAVNRQITSNDLYHSALLAQARVPLYAQLVETPEVLDRTISDTGLAISSRDLAERITVSYEQDTALLNISVRDTRPGGAKALADAVARNLTDVAQDVESTGERAGAVELRALSEATFPTLPTTPNRPLNLLIGFGAGLLAALSVLSVTAARLYLQRRRTESRWTYLNINGEIRLALVHLIDARDTGLEGPSTVQISVKPLPATTPPAITNGLAEARS